MSKQEDADDFYAAGRQLAEHIADLEGKEVSTASLQALIRDLLPRHEELQESLRSIVARPDFLQLVKSAGRGGGIVRKNAFIQSLRKVYSMETLEAADYLASGVMGHDVTFNQKESEGKTDIFETISQQSIDNESIRSSLSMNSEQVKSSQVAGRKSYFDSALEIAKRMGIGNLEIVSMNTSGKGLINYVLRDSNGNSLGKVSLAMIDANLRSGISTKQISQNSAGQLNTASESSQMFLKALELARRMGNGNLQEASVATSSKGIFNYSIRDAMSNTLAKVPLSMLYASMN